MIAKMVLDEATTARLRAAGDRVELCDESGRTFGFFVPAEGLDRPLADWVEARTTPGEIEGSAADPVDYSTAEVLDYLKGL